MKPNFHVSPVKLSVVSPTVIGRTVQLEMLSRLLELAHGGQGQAALLSGEAGVGKTRLVVEARGHAARLGFSILQGNCFEPDRSLPYAPLLELLRGYFAQSLPEEIARDWGPLAPELAHLLPELPALLPDLSPAPALNPEQDQYRLFHALEQFLFRLATQRPLLVVIEDIQWSDDASLDFLLYSVRRLASRPVLLLLTYRSEEEGTSLARFLAGLDRTRLANEMPLVPLTPGEVDAMLRAIFKLERPVSAEFLNAIHKLTEGNPFFIEEVLKSLLATGDIFYRQGTWDRKPINQLRIPRSVQIAVQQRMDQLGPAAKQLLVLAALTGRRFNFVLLQELIQMDEPALLQQLKKLMAAHLIVEESADGYAFRHALTREAVYATLLRRERRRYHRAIAETLERLYANRLDTYLADLSYHYYQAEAWEKALEFSRRAGERAQTLFAPREAGELLTRALDAARQLGLSAPAILYRTRGQSYETLGEFERARADYEQALQMAQQSEDRQAEWQGLIDLGFLWAANDYMKTGDYFRHALELARTLEDPSLMAHSLNRLGNWHLNLERPHEARQCHVEALAIFERLGDKQGQAETLDLLGLASELMAHCTDALGYLEQSVVLFRELDDRRGLASSLAIMSELGPWHGMDAVALAAVTLADGARYAGMSLDIARQIGWRSGEAYALIALGACSRSMGQYAQGLEQTHKGLEIAEEIGHRQWMTMARVSLGFLYLDLLALPTARQYLEQALSLAREVNSRFWIVAASSALASAHMQQKELGQAASLLNAALESDAPLQTFAQKLWWMARLELALASGKAGQALDIARQLVAAVTESAPQSSQPWQSAPRLLKLHGEALTASKRYAEAEANLKTALDATRAQKARPLQWRIHLAFGRLYRVRRMFEAAEGEFSAARIIIAELAGAVPDENLRQNFLLRALAELPPPTGASPRRAAKRAYGGLTEREREVAALIGQSRSNREIAETLVLSERTVEKHISNILGKLGLETRAQLIAWTLEKGLAKNRQHYSG